MPRNTGVKRLTGPQYELLKLIADMEAGNVHLRRHSDWSMYAGKWVYTWSPVVRPNARVLASLHENGLIWCETVTRRTVLITSANGGEKKERVEKENTQQIWHLSPAGKARLEQEKPDGPSQP